MADIFDEEFPDPTDHASVSEKCKNVVICNFDVIVDADKQPRILDIEGSGILPNKTTLGTLLRLDWMEVKSLLCA